MTIWDWAILQASSQPWFRWTALACMPAYWYLDVVQARWLPWWRRYAPSVLITLSWALRFAGHEGPVEAVIGWLGIVFFWWNMNTAGRNRRDRNDVRSAEARAALTAVQERAFQREARSL